MLPSFGEFYAQSSSDLGLELRTGTGSVLQSRKHLQLNPRSNCKCVFMSPHVSGELFY